MYKRLFFLMTFAVATHVHAYDDSPSCFKDLQTNFFSYDAVAQALSMHYTQQGQWQLYYTAIKDRAKYVPDILKARAAKMDPNPLEHPFQAKAAEELLEQVLYDVFYDAMIYNGYTNQSSIRDMFHYIRQQNAYRIQQCLGIDIDAPI